MRKQLLINLLFCLGVLYSSAQTTIAAAEYFFDNDPGVGNGTAVSVTAADTITGNYSFSVSSLSIGRHLFCFRTKDNLGRWSVPAITPFVVAPKGNQITKAEYFFDTDPGIGNANSYSFTAGDTIANNFSLSTTGLSNGRHLLCLRTKDDAGNWGAITTGSFLYEPKGSQLVKGEYFFDSDPGMGNATAFTFSSADTINNNFTLPVPSISLGQHLLCIRMKDNAGNWGMLTSNLLQVSPLNTSCVDAEFYFDLDPGVGKGSLLNLNLSQDTINMNSLAVPVPLSMTTGTHYLFIRSKNNGRVFSLATIDTFDVMAAPLPVTLLNFTAQKFNQQVLLRWQTAQEINNRGFEIQRSADGINFSVIGWVNGIGNSFSISSYSFTDTDPVKGKNYYRLKQVDLDGKSKLSEVRMVNMIKPISVLIHPNPVKDVLYIESGNENITQVRIMNAQGQQIGLENVKGSRSLSIPFSQYAAGLYLVIVTDDHGSSYTEKVLKK